MKKLFIILLALCLIFTFTACTDNDAPDTDPVVDDDVTVAIPSIDRYEVEAIIVQYENSGQYFLSDAEISEFAQLYNEPDSFELREADLGEEEYVVVITYTNGGYLLINKYDHLEYDFAVIEYVEQDSLHNPKTAYLIENSPLVTFMDKLIQRVFITN